MRDQYYCPHCHKVLNPGESVILVVQHGGEHELILLSPYLGDYSAVYPVSFTLELGELYTFRCPLCHTDLTSKANQRLAEVLLTGKDGSRARVSFSRVFGECATFVSTGDRIEQYGEHASRYEPRNFFGEAQYGDGD